jgi:hypothetical protein
MLKFRTPKPPLSFGKQTNFFQAAFGGALSLISEPLHKQCFLAARELTDDDSAMMARHEQWMVQ